MEIFPFFTAKVEKITSHGSGRERENEMDVRGQVGHGHNEKDNKTKRVKC